MSRRIRDMAAAAAVERSLGGGRKDRPAPTVIGQKHADGRLIDLAQGGLVDRIRAKKQRLIMHGDAAQFDQLVGRQFEIGDMQLASGDAMAKIFDQLLTQQDRPRLVEFLCCLA